MSADTDSKTQRHPHARLCHVIKNDNFDGYGFNLHAEKNKTGQYIGKVDEGSPAEAAGLRQGDRILEVNGVSIANETHKQVVQRIKALADETKLLVVDPEDEALDKTPRTDDVTSSATFNDNSSVSSSKSESDATTASANNNGQAQTEVEDTINSNTSNGSSNNSSASLNLKMTAAELRAKLAAKKKFDPRKETIDFKKKFDVVQKL